MAETRPIILITRPAQASRQFTDSLIEQADRRAEIVEAPLQEIADVGPTASLEPNEIAIFTSQHAPSRVTANIGTRAYCVGETTAAAALAAGFAPTLAKGDADSLIQCIETENPVEALIYFRGQHVSVDLADVLASRGFSTASKVVYAQQDRPLPAEIAHRLLSEKRVIVPVFSARSAERIAAELPEQITPTIVAISEKTASAWDRPAEAVFVASEPTTVRVLDATLAALDSDSPS